MFSAAIRRPNLYPLKHPNCVRKRVNARGCSDPLDSFQGSKCGRHRAHSRRYLVEYSSRKRVWRLVMGISLPADEDLLHVGLHIERIAIGDDDVGCFPDIERSQLIRRLPRFRAGVQGDGFQRFVVRQAKSRPRILPDRADCGNCARRTERMRSSRRAFEVRPANCKQRRSARTSLGVS